MSDRLEPYRAKRDPDRSGEPRGSSRGSSGSRYAIQHHAASSDHYDLRLEHDGVLLSWAVPKGPSTDPREKRLATRTEDHPVDYADFEGRIPEGEYGAGEVIVWDAGTWRSTTQDDDGAVSVDEALGRGHLSFEVSGRKLTGGYTLQHLRGDDWLLIKKGDDGSDARRNPTSTEPESVQSGLTVQDMADRMDRQEGDE
ncbi:DNA polymerase ligase N-terminal domain-containing protein [Isoptericola sp. b441]|uniref:DNA polymerase ligase N-terminal domain-containing protein n=1 Tax=Actinotalea lenta TaxID=3064654 RepID=A0ABT9DAB8_9CELL|nr:MULTISPECIES: DNA polymerase ligase N-terminal domain-containing protein [unclassified Isoptericola]MDO8107855.1 DNA polymerase ligase N-terminal domain-containing protein [Isoptericola sp. b441]MDO8120475.1 DNA polymerase ligase N-terminal domain-containing protein [Isoptericola sp. b490]